MSGFAGTRPGIVGRPLVRFRRVTSTNAVACRLAESGCGEGIALVADFQSAGRGRLGRSWQAPAGSSLLLSVLFRPALDPARVQWLTMMCGLAVVDAVYEETGLRAGLKWPNDVVVMGSKLAGILAEASFAEDRVAFCVVGVGLNVDLDPDRLSPPLATPATSLLLETGNSVSQDSLLCRLLGDLDRRYGALQRGWSPCDEWAAHLTTLGQPVTILDGSEERSGVAIAVESSGALLVSMAGGGSERVVAGDVVLRHGAGWREGVGPATIATRDISTDEGTRAFWQGVR